jgi:transmembrane sensor
MKNNENNKKEHEEEAFFSEINSLPSDFLDEIKREVKNNRQMINKRKKSIFFFASMASAACILCVAYLSFFLDNVTFTHDYVAANKVREKIILPDKSVISLDVNTEMKIKFYEDRREIYLSKGKAFFDVYPNKKRPFFVKTDKTTIKVLGTKFEVVNHEKFELNVKEGKVSVSNKHNNLIALVTKNQNLKLNKYYLIDSLKQKDSTQMALWSEGKFNFKQESLKDILSMFSKHIDTNTEINDKSLENLKISGNFNSKEFDKFIYNLPLIHNVKIEKIGNKFIIRK